MSTEGSDGPRDTISDKPIVQPKDEAHDTLQETPRISLSDLARRGKRVPSLTGTIDTNLVSNIAMILVVTDGHTDDERIKAVADRMAQESTENPDFEDESFRISVADLVVRSGMDFTEAVYKVKEDMGEVNGADTSDTIAEEPDSFDFAVMQVMSETGMSPEDARAEVQRQIDEGIIKLDK